MKKILCIAAFAGMFTLGYCQDVKVNINNQEATTKEECPYRINGICSSEDIGGVDVQIEYIDNTTWAVFTNYNSFPVTVLYQVSSKGTHRSLGYMDNFITQDGATGSIVIGVNNSKKIKLDYCPYISTSWYDNSSCYSIKGIIVRRLAN